jgi:hypothetical protein
MDFNLSRVVSMLNQAVLKLGQEIKALQATALTTTTADARYAPKGTASNTGDLSIIDSIPQDISPAGASTDLSDSSTLMRVGSSPSTDLSDSSDLARKSTANTFVEQLTLEKSLSLKDGINGPAAIVGYAQIYVDLADGDLKIIFGDGVVKTIVTDV